LASSDKYDIRQTIEGNNVYDFGLGTSAALPFTVSFWVRASIAGAYALAFQNGAGDRSYVTSYTINAINTWEFKIISLTGDVTGTWLKDNGAGLTVIWGLSQNGSSTQTATLNAWQPGALTSFAGAVNWIGTSGATFLITGAQIEKGTTASAFEVRSYATEMQLCQIYYESSYPYGVKPGSAPSYQDFTYDVAYATTGIRATLPFKISKRTACTANIYSFNGDKNRVSSVAGGMFNVGANVLATTFGITGYVTIADSSAPFVVGTTYAIGWEADAEF
jgi:hypothetical protein